MSMFPRFMTTCLCFFFSGVAALVYQIAWTRQFALVFGTSELAVATVLAAYMAGLALGARIVEAGLPRIARPARLYALLEAGIAATAVIWVPLCLWGAQVLLVAMLGGQPEPPASGQTGATLFYLVAAFITLLIPTSLMGATLPLLVRDGVHTQAQVGRRVGLLYVCNTAGAVLGALLSALWLLPSLGLRGTVWTAAFINLLVAGLAMALLSQRMNAESALPEREAVAEGSPERRPINHAQWILPLMLASGAVSFLHEVLWTRMLSHVVGGSIIAFGVMVASFLLGITLGGGLGAWLARTRVFAARLWSWSQMAIALTAMLAWYGIQHWAPVDATLSGKVLFGLAVLLPLSMAIGATYPLAVRVMTARADDAARASARVYAWNTVGAILGALLGGFWLIPALRYEGAVQLAVAISAALAVLAIWLWLRTERKVALATTLVSVMAAASFWPGVPEAVLRQSPLRDVTGERVFYSVGRSADVMVFRDDATYDLRTNGLPEAGIEVLGAVPVVSAESWMPVLAVLARPQTRDMLVVGFGGGNAVQAVPPSVRQVDVIELEPEVIAANEAIAANRNRNPLRDRRVNVILNDARGALLLTNKTYDAVVSQPSHPWTAGASHLYTREFMQQARAHLNPGGVFVQWMSTDFVDAALLKGLLATALDVFAEVRVYRTSPNTLLIMGSDQPLQIEHNPAALQATLLQQENHFVRSGMGGLEDLLAAWVLDTDDARRLAADGMVITDDNNRLATAGVHDFRRAMKPREVSELLASYDPLTRTEGVVYQQLHGVIAWPYLLDRIASWASSEASYGERVLRVLDLLGSTDIAAYARSRLALRTGNTGVAAQILNDARRRWPQSALLNYAVVEPALGALSAGNATGEVRQAAAQLTDEPLLVLRALALASQEKWGELAALDGQLAFVPWTAPWAIQAAQLRVEWRARVGNAELRPRFGGEAIAIVDRVLQTQTDGFWLALRALNAVGTDQPQLMLESIAAFAVLAVEKAPVLTGEERVLAQRRATQLLQLLDGLRDNSRVAAGRWDEVRGRLLKAQRVLSGAVA